MVYLRRAVLGDLQEIKCRCPIKYIVASVQGLVSVPTWVGTQGWTFYFLERPRVIAPVAMKLFQQQRKAYPESIRRPKENLELLPGNYYQIIYDRNTQALSLSRRNENTALIKIVNNQIKIARGLTAEDMSRWQQIQALINSP